MAKAKKLPSGNWRVNQYVGLDENSKRIYKSFTADTKKEAEYMAAEYVMHRKKKPDEITVGDAINRYIDSKDNILSPTTVSGYRQIRRNTMQNLMDIPLKNISTALVQKEINREALKLSPKSIRNSYGLLTYALNVYHPDLKLRLTFPAPEKQIKDLVPIHDILRVAKGSEIELPILLAAWLTMRMSEIRGLKYTDIKNGFLIISEVIVDVDGIATSKLQTKSFESTRKLRVPAYIQNLIDQTDHTQKYIVNLDGKAIYRRFKKLLKTNNLPHMRFHDLRHLNASIMVMLGVPNKYAMERGGWKTGDILEDVYQHTFSDERNLIDDRIDAFMMNEIENT